MNTGKGSLPNNGGIVLFLVILNGIVLSEAYTSRKEWYLVLFFTIPLLLLSMLGKKMKKHSAQSKLYRINDLGVSVTKRTAVKSPSEVEL